MIPAGKSYIEHRLKYERDTRNTGYTNLHGLRHAYAQRRYEQLAGMKCPLAGGKSKAEMTKEEKLRDQVARDKISLELGHARRAIAKCYLG